MEKPSSLFTELTEVVDNFEKGCTCAAIAQLEVIWAQKKYCSVE
jgi:hypothetical protein